jgi:hypothetical protein
MLDHDVKRISACIFAKLRPHRNVSANDRLQARANRREDVS